MTNKKNETLKKDIITLYKYAVQSKCFENIPENALEELGFESWESVDDMMEKKILVYSDGDMRVIFDAEAAVKKFPSLRKYFKELDASAESMNEEESESDDNAVDVHSFLESIIAMINKKGVVVLKDDKKYTALPISDFKEDDAMLVEGINLDALKLDSDVSDKHMLVGARVLHELCVQEGIHADLSEFIKRNEEQRQQNPGKEIKGFAVSEDLVVKFFKELRYTKALYKPEKLHGDLAKYNGRRILTGRITNFRRCMRSAIAWVYKMQNNAVKGVYIDEALNVLVSKRILHAEEITDCTRYNSIPQYFVAGGAAYFMNAKGFKGFFNI